MDVSDDDETKYYWEVEIPEIMNVNGETRTSEDLNNQSIHK